MALKPIGSEKLTGQDKINRIMEIATYGETEKTPLTILRHYHLVKKLVMVIRTLLYKKKTVIT